MKSKNETNQQPTGSRVKADPDAWIRVIDRMLGEPEYEFARETLEGIREWVEEEARITAKQINAIQNIRRSAL